jgi:hypothetical protein
MWILAVILILISGMAGLITEVKWMVWIIIGAIIAALIIDWFIVMGPDPKKWKGGGGNENHKR